MTSATAFAAIDTPSSAAYETTIFPERDFMSAGWKSAGTALTFKCRRAIAGRTGGMAWMKTGPNDERLGITITEVGGTGGPGMGECPAPTVNSVAAATPTAVNAAVGSGLNLSGATFDASSVTVAPDDAKPATAAVTTSGPAGTATGIYSVNLTGAQLATLTDGTLTATSSFIRTADTIAGSGMTVLEDTGVPQAPTTDTAPGTYPSAQSIRLSRAAGEVVSSVVHDTTDGSAPTAASPISQPVAITSNRTVNAVVVDRAGNVSASSAFALTIAAPRALAVIAQATGGTAGAGGTAAAQLPLAPRIGRASSGARGGPRPAMARWITPTVNGAVVDTYQVPAIRIRPGRAAKALPPVGRKSARRLKLSLPAGSYRFQVRAVSAAGNGVWPATSNKVVAR